MQQNILNPDIAVSVYAPADDLPASWIQQVYYSFVLKPPFSKENAKEFHFKSFIYGSVYVRGHSFAQLMYEGNFGSCGYLKMFIFFFF